MKKYIIIGILFSSFVSGIFLRVYGEKNERKEHQKKERRFSLEEIKACQKDSDCVKVNEGCCSCAMGGRELAVHKNYRQYWENKLKDECRIKRFCLAVYRCTFAKAVCDFGACAIQRGQNGQGKGKKKGKF